MDTEGLEQLLEAGGESQTLEFKGAMAWSAKSLAKDLLALANVRDGGIIIIGVEDGSFARQGVSAAFLATYKPDEMRDQMTKFADPHVEFTVSFPTDKDGLQYIAIEVAAFREIPVICRSDSADVKAGTIYYRNSNRRPESAAVSNSYDMRDIIMIASSRTKKRFEELGLNVSSEADETRKALDNELEGL